MEDSDVVLEVRKDVRAVDRQNRLLLDEGVNDLHDLLSLSLSFHVFSTQINI